MARAAVGLPLPSVCAEERSGQRIRARDCLSEAQRSEFERDPAGREHRRLPEAKRRDADSGVAFSLVTFFWRSKRKLLRRRAHSPAPALRTGKPQDQKTNPERRTTNQLTINSIATSAHPTSVRAQFNQNLNPTQHLQRRTPRRQLLQLRPEHSRLLPPPRMAQRSHQHAQRLP